MHAQLYSFRLFEVQVSIFQCVSFILLSATGVVRDSAYHGCAVAIMGVDASIREFGWNGGGSRIAKNGD